VTPHPRRCSSSEACPPRASPEERKRTKKEERRGKREKERGGEILSGKLVSGGSSKKVADYLPGRRI